MHYENFIIDFVKRSHHSYNCETNICMGKSVKKLFYFGRISHHVPYVSEIMNCVHTSMLSFATEKVIPVSVQCQIKNKVAMNS